MEPHALVIRQVSVVIPARDAAGTLDAAVRSASSQSVNHDLEVVIAVGPSADGTREVADRIARSDSRVRVVDNPVGTTPSGLNTAIASSSGEVVVRLDAHATLPPGYVATAIETLVSTGAGNVGGRQAPVAERGTAAAIAAAMRSPFGSGGAAYRSGTRAREVETVYLGVFRRDALADVGGFDERLVRNQDYELNHRLRQAGWTVWFDPRLEVAYRPRGSLRALARQFHGYGRYKRVVMREHPDSVRSRQLAPLAMATAVGGSLLLGAVLGSAVVPAVVAGGYVGTVVVAGLVADLRRGPAVAAALAVMHWSWAAGFVRGVRPGVGHPLRPGA